MTPWVQDDRWDPGNPSNRERTRRLQRQLRAHLMRWDPIGVGDAPEAQDEYDAYISGLMHLLHGGAAVHDVNRHLTRLAEGFGVRSQPALERQVAETLVAWWRETTAE